MKGSMRALCVGCFILVASVALVNAGDTCPVAVAPSLRVDCAYPGITESQCAERKCCWGPGQASGVPECYYPGEAVPITTVHVVQACHLDVGFKEMAHDIVNLYFDTHFPHAIEWAAQLRKAGGPAQLRFMTQSYLVSLFMSCPAGMGLHCPNATYVEQFKEAVNEGSIYWHAFPFNAELEVMSPDLVQFGVQMTHHLDHQFGQSEKITLSQRDVPGMTRSVLPLLAKEGVQAISVGVNGASKPPNVPRIFMWHDPVSNTTMPAMWHPHGYGGTERIDAVIVPGLSHALVFEWNGDNDGPPPIDDIESTFASVAKEFPGAKVISSTFDEFTRLLPGHTQGLPVLSKEIGDTWMYGVPSDPYAVAQMRAVQSIRSNCLAAGTCSTADASFYNMSRLFVKSAEHTWGEDVKTWLNDTTNWSNEDFAAVRDSESNFLTIQQSWVEQRNWSVNYPVSALGAGMQRDIQAAFDAIPATDPDPVASGFHRLTGTTGVRAGSFDVGVGAGGALSKLVHRPTGTVLANSSKLLGQLEYRTYDLSSYKTFWKEYFDVQPPPYYGPLDFGKPGFQVADPVSTLWLPTVQDVWLKQPVAGGRAELLSRVTFNDTVVSQYGAPAVAWVNVTVPDASAANPNLVAVTVLVVNKTATRLPESMFVRFDLAVDAVSDTDETDGSTRGWAMDKLGEFVSPLDVQDGGAQHLHGVWTGVRYTPEFASSASSAILPLPPTARGSEHTRQTPAYKGVAIHTVEAPVVAWTGATPSAFPTPCNATPALADGPAFVLYDNLWGTNYRMWWPFTHGEQDSIAFRFGIEVV